MGILITTIILTIANNIRTSDLKKQVSSTLEQEQNETVADVFTMAASQKNASSQATTQENESIHETKQEYESIRGTTQEGESQKETLPAWFETKAGDGISVSFATARSSEDAAMLLENAGVIDNWREFNKFLIDNGYDRRLSSGTFNFAGDETYDEIAARISR